MARLNALLGSIALVAFFALAFLGVRAHLIGGLSGPSGAETSLWPEALSLFDVFGAAWDAMWRGSLVFVALFVLLLVGYGWVGAKLAGTLGPRHQH